MKLSTTLRILNQVFYNVSGLQRKTFQFSKRKSHLYPPHEPFASFSPPDTMSSSSLQYPHSRDKRNHRLNNNLCTHLHKKFKCCFYSAVPLFSQYGLYICKIWLPLKVQQKLELSLCHTCLTSSEKNSEDIETFWLPVKKTHTRTTAIYSNKDLWTSSNTFSIGLPKGRLLSNLGGSVGRSDTGVVGEEFS